KLMRTPQAHARTLGGLRRPEAVELVVERTKFLPRARPVCACSLGCAPGLHFSLTRQRHIRTKSPPARGARIETRPGFAPPGGASSRPPRGGRGLKPCARRASIPDARVAPRAGGPD